MMNLFRTGALVVVLAISISACDSATPLEVATDLDRAPSVNDGISKYAFESVAKNLKDGTFTVCKSAPDDVNKSFTFNTTYVLGDVNNQPISVVPSVELADGYCEDVFVSVWGPDQVKITEVVPDGWDSAPELEVWTLDNNGNVTLDPHGPANWISGAIEEGKAGCLVIFKNSKLDVPGGQGCTPGYWKNNWSKKGGTAWGPTGVAGGDALSSAGFVGFTTVDGDATTFADALAAGGGGENALMRHAAAAYLNAAHDDIAYGMTTAQVVAATNAVLGTDDVEAQKNIFDAANNQGCPLDQHGRVK